MVEDFLALENEHIKQPSLEDTAVSEIPIVGLLSTSKAGLDFAELK